VKDIYIQIEPFKNRLAGRLSGGMKQKLALSCALIHAPEVLILDEPTTGVDAVSRKEFWDMLQRLKKRGITILVSTPYMDEASLCDRVALIEKGEIMRVDTPENIVKSYENPVFSVKSDNMYALPDDLELFPGHISAWRFGDAVHLTIERTDTKQKEIEKFLVGKGHSNLSIEKILPGIEDCFMAYMNR
ncbi:MAG: ABC transporter ATP-binding protein, partial [Bacteroidales bacterium]|nr:ABC transporter ATP-binding protein [Bacteroidales bacterium]